MQTATLMSPTVELVGTGLGEFAGPAEVSALQRALTQLSQAAGWVQANPGKVTGTVTNQTVLAVGAVLPELVRKLPGKISKTTAQVLQVALAAAPLSSTAMSSAKSAIGSAAQFLTPAVLALSAIFAKSSAPPVPTQPIDLSKLSFGTKTLAPGATRAPALPAGSIQARTKSGLFRVAVPRGFATQLGGPAVSLGADFQELPPRTAFTPGVRLVSEKQLEKDTDDRPFFKKPLFWAAAGGGLAVLGGGFYLMRRR